MTAETPSLGGASSMDARRESGSLPGGIPGLPISLDNPSSSGLPMRPHFAEPEKGLPSGVGIPRRRGGALPTTLPLANSELTGQPDPLSPQETATPSGISAADVPASAGDNERAAYPADVPHEGVRILASSERTVPQDDRAERERVLAKLQERVDRAAESAPVRVHTADRTALVEDLTEAYEEGKISMNQHPDTLITLVSPPDEAWEVVILDPTLYRDLIKMGKRKIEDDANTVLSDKGIDSYAKRTEKHEMAHAREALKDSRLTVRYCIGFQRDEEGQLTMRPFIKVDGQTTMDRRNKIAEGPAGHLSHSDRAKLGEEGIKGAVQRARELEFTTFDDPAGITAVAAAFAHTFIEEPAIVVMDPANMDVFFEREEEGMDFAYIPGINNAAYDSVYNIVFASEGGNIPFTRNHEVAHAVIDEINPSLQESGNQLNEAYGAHRRGESVQIDTIVGLIMPTIIGRAIHEGFATEVSINISPGHEAEMKRTELLDPLGAHSSLGSPVIIEQEAIDESFGRIEESIELYKRLFETGNRDAFDKIASRLSARMHARYVVGFFFCHQAISYLRNSGATDRELAEWRRRLVENPPQTIDQMRDPVGYVRQQQSQLNAQ